ncbi:MAG TPA: phosphoglycerate mutase family protein [Candidatus Dormibacteraeota bacterium]|nr:phosphoglycerate mutase family protein [Candidatus Dormibacteraeota bacterium]
MRTFYVVRHAKAGSRSHWTGDDRLRPLSKKGQVQAQELVALLKRYPLATIFSSPYLRCVQTVEPLANANRLEVRTSVELAEGHGLDGLHEFLDDSKLDHAVLSTHGDIVWELVDDLVSRHVIRAGDGGFEKGSTWVLAMRDGVVSKARYLPAP